jgi:hypothetical protein
MKPYIRRVSKTSIFMFKIIVLKMRSKKELDFERNFSQEKNIKTNTFYE